MRKIIFVTLILFSFILIPLGAGAGLIAWDVFEANDPNFSKEKILEILSKESVLYYADGTTQLGSIFGQEHRLYITIDQVPKEMKEAIVAAEDQDFYDNIGIDPKGIVRALIHNFFNKSRQGASTITQQTVKNLFGRKKTDVVTKVKEMIDAFKLERNFTKEQILEFYLNQFHVTGNGRGIGVAAKYYFNKNVEDLNLVESAFIAGSVKGPEKYNPFTKTSLLAQENAKELAYNRKRYVLDRMLDTKKITQQQYDLAAKEPVPFNQGKFQFNELAVNQIIQKQLMRPEILKAIGVESLEEISSMGLHITTTLENRVQSAAQYGLRKNLSRVQMILSGFSKEDPNEFFSIQKPEIHAFYTGKIDRKSPEFVVSLGIPKCTIPNESIENTALILDQAVMSGVLKSKDKLLNDLHEGDYVLVSLHHTDESGRYYCELEVRPKLQGAAIILDKGALVGMAGGFSSNEYNRAIFARRQPGSTYKVPTYFSALQMGWTVLDSISNIRDVFPWQGQYYYPRPDHEPKSLETTIVGAGATSENLASIWVLRHLLDKLSYSQYENLLEFLEILKPNTPIDATLKTIVDKFNAYPNDEFNIKEGLLDKIKNELITDFNVLSDNRLRVFVRTLHYGRNFDQEAARVNSTFSGGRNLKSKDASERDFRLNALKNNIIRWKQLSENSKKAVELISRLYSKEDSSNNVVLTETDRQLLSNFGRTKDGFITYSDPDPWKPRMVSRLVDNPEIIPIPLNEILSIGLDSKPIVEDSSEVLLDGVIPVSMIQNILDSLNNQFAELVNAQPLEKLFWNSDFKYSLGMYYTAKLVSKMSGQNNVQWVPSFPLGSNDVTLAELALMYQTFLEGKTYTYFENDNPNQIVVIKRIEDQSGNLIWESVPKEFQFTDPFYVAPIMNVLRSTVTAGTAYQLNWNLILRSDNRQFDDRLKSLKIRVPSFGKTGTTNNFTNGTYIGFLPYPTSFSKTLSPENAYTIASYIGYDSNLPMRRGGYKVYGGAAIPAWEEIALNIIKEKNYAEKLSWSDYRDGTKHLIPFSFGSRLTEAVVSMTSGLTVAKQDPDQSNINTLEKNKYVNDYSETGQNLIKLFLDGDTSDEIFLPTRKVIFYNTAGAPKTENPVEMSTLDAEKRKFKEFQNSDKDSGDSE